MSLSVFFLSTNDVGEEDETLETKLQRKLIRRQANNATERLIVIISPRGTLQLTGYLPFVCIAINWLSPIAVFIAINQLSPLGAYCN